MKRTFSLLTTAALILTMSACGGQTPADTGSEEQKTSAATGKPSGTAAAETEAEKTTAAETETEKNTAETTTTEATTAKPVQNKSDFSQDATIDETVLIDEDGIKVTAKELTYSKYSASLELTFENSSSSDITLMSGTLGYSCNSVNGIMVSGGYFNCELKAGKKAKESVTFNYEDLLVYGIDEIADIELGIYSTPGGFDYTYYPVSQIKTSAADSYDYDRSRYRNSFTSSDMQSEHNYNVIYSSEDTLYDVDDVSIVSEIMFENKRGESLVMIEAQNNSAYQSRLKVNEIYINGIRVNSSNWTSELINPGKSAMIDVNLSSVFDNIYWDLYGIKTINNIKLGIGQTDREGNNESKPVIIEIPVSGSGNTVDTSGTVAYDEGGVRVIFKGVTGGKSDYDDDMYVMLLVENKSGNTILIDDDYDSFSLNGFMADSYIYSITVGNDECAVWEIQIPDRALEDCDVKQTSDIKDVEFGIEIRDESWSNKREGAVSIKLG